MASTCKRNHEGDSSDEESNVECPVCLQKCVLPVRLPCRHIFCFLCAKGFCTPQSGFRCAICRQTVSVDYFDKPDVVGNYDKKFQEECQNCSCNDECGTSSEEYTWFYEGRNGGWWQYEERLAKDFEEKHNNGLTRFDTIICGKVYVIDLFSLLQYRKDRPSQMRRIIRDLPSHVNLKKGIAGLPKRRRWWQYDERTCLELEQSYQKEERKCEVLIAGHVYLINFDEMLQYRKRDPPRKRKVKRDVKGCPKKGIAGLRLQQQSDDSENNDDNDAEQLISRYSKLSIGHSTREEQI